MAPCLVIGLMLFIIGVLIFAHYDWYTNPFKFEMGLLIISGLIIAIAGPHYADLRTKPCQETYEKFKLGTFDNRLYKIPYNQCQSIQQMYVPPGEWRDLVE